MKLVTVATHSERYYPYLNLSAKKCGHQLITLGWGEKWQGFAWKFDLMKTYLRTLKEDEVVCFVDAFDVVVLEDAPTIERKFLGLVDGDTNKILISKEQYSHNGLENGIISYLQSFVFTKCKSEYINSGTYIGISSTLLRIFEGICNEFNCSPNADDQRLLQDYCVKHNDVFVIDNKCNMFLVINSTITKIKDGEYDISFLGEKLAYKNDTFPAFFHGNGYTDFDYIIERLGYDTSIFKADGESKTKYVWGRLMGFLPIAFERLWIFIVVLLLFIVYIFRKKIGFNKVKPYRFKR